MAPPRVSAFRPDQLWQHTLEPMFWLDQELRIAWVNHAWEVLTGRTAESIVGQKCASHGPLQAGEPADLAASFVPPPEAVAGSPAGTTTLILTAGGERLWRTVEFWPIDDQSGSLIGLLGLVREAETPASAPNSQAHELRVELMRLRDQLHRAFGFESLIGAGPAHRRLLEQVRLAAASAIPVLIVGEPGTGKRMVARTIHHLGANRNRPLVPLDCEALPFDMLEGELFARGRRADAQTDGHDLLQSQSPSRLSFADGTSLLLRNILALPRDLQTRLTGSLDGRVRLIGTAAGDPEAALAHEQLHPDFYYTLTALLLRLEPLRKRRAELPLLAQHLLERCNERACARCGGLTPQAALALESYDWPGNLRELARVIEVAFVQSQAEAGHGTALIDVDHLPASIRGNLGAGYLAPPRNSIKPLDELLTEIERRLIETALAKARQNKSRAAEVLGISRPRLYRRIKELNLPDESEPEEDDHH
jgi:DNA-binding NtrC family response regulator